MWEIPHSNQELKMELKLTNNFLESLEIDYILEYSCLKSGCIDEGICRCGQIKDISIKKVNLNLVTNSIYNQIFDGNQKQTKRNNLITEIIYGGKEVDLYCINRILSINQVWNPDNWEIKVEKGFYTQIIKEVSIKEDLFRKIENEISSIQLKKLSEKIKFLLNLEYGFLPQSLSESNFEIIKINKNDIDWKKTNANHLQNIQRFNYYEDYSLIRGIVKKEGKKFTIIDGYNRINSVRFLRKFKVFLAY